jgi:predicted short-subunit dehydrogenase-like oxidoreductase (DUF2520 family)
MPERLRRTTASPYRIAIVGGGVVGSTLGRLFAEGGAEITAVVSRTTTSARRAGKFIGCRNVGTSVDAIPPRTTLIYITAPHDAISGVAAEIGALDGLAHRKLAVCHASGILTAAALEPTARAGATVFSFHPLQTFPRGFRPAALLDLARGIPFGVDGSARGLRHARRLASLIGGTVMVVPPETRPLYHAACVVASNHLTTLLSVLEQMFHAVGVRRPAAAEAFGPIMRATMLNAERTSPAASLSGPIARGGVSTVSAHLDALGSAVPELIPYFVAVSRETVRLARRRGSITPGQERALLDVLAAPFGAAQSREDQ